MDKEYKSLKLKEQIELFEYRGLKIPDKEKAIKKLKYINYYKLKELAYPFYKKNEHNEFFTKILILKK